MEARRLKRDVEALIDNYIGQKLREKSFDPKGRGTRTMLDQLAHYDLAIGVALWWLDRDEGRGLLDGDERRGLLDGDEGRGLLDGDEGRGLLDGDEGRGLLDRDGGRGLLDRDMVGAAIGSGGAWFPDRSEREAMILSSFAGIVLSRLPVEEILALYRCRPAASYPNQQAKGTLVYPFTLSYHPFAMLGSYKAVYHSKKHSQKLRRWLSERMKARAPPGRVSGNSSSSSSSSSSSPSHSFLSDISDHPEKRVESLAD